MRQKSGEKKELGNKIEKKKKKLTLTLTFWTFHHVKQNVRIISEIYHVYFMSSLHFLRQGQKPGHLTFLSVALSENK